MKIIFLIVLMALGALIAVAGILFKIMHWPGSRPGMLLGASLAFIALVLLIMKLLKDDQRPG